MFICGFLYTIKLLLQLTTLIMVGNVHCWKCALLEMCTVGQWAGPNNFKSENIFYKDSGVKKCSHLLGLRAVRKIYHAGMYLIFITAKCEVERKT